MQELWVPIQGFEGYYEISNLGRVRTVSRFIPGVNRVIKPRIKSTSIIKSTGYPSVMLSKNHADKRFLLHRLMAIAFIPNPDNLPVVHHKNDMRADYRLENLEWCTQSSNILRLTSKATYRNNMQGRTSELSPRSKAIVQRSSDGVRVIKAWPSAMDASRELKINHGGICTVANGLMKRKTAGGFKWEWLT